MAEVTTGVRPKGGPRQNKKSTRIDMTAMVDVAFLLLTFFILTTTLASPRAMELITPPDGSNLQAVAQSKVMTLLLGENDAVHYVTYLDGSEEPTVGSTDFSADGIRKVILEHLNRFPNRCPKGTTVAEMEAHKCWDPILVLKPSRGSKYKNVVDILDEMRINQVLKYVLTEVTPEDSLLMVAHGLK